MGEIGMMRDLSNRHRTALAATLFVLLIWATGCRSGSPPAAMGRAEPEPPAAAGATDEQSAFEASAIEVRSVEVREGAPETVLEIVADGPLVWTSFRDALGNVVIELPNTVLGPGVEGTEDRVGLVESVDAQTDAGGRRPKTLLILTTSEEVEHDLRAEGDRLVVELMPVDVAPAAPTLAFEPIAEEEDAEPMADPEPREEMAPRPAAANSERMELGTPEQPVRGPEPEGVRATRLRDVRVEQAGDTTVVEISGDGELDYSTFRLGEPERFVIDLLGVVNQEARSAIPVASATVEAVRVAQFKPFPEPVSRVVVDLDDRPRPEIERTPDSLIVRFHRAGGDGDAAMGGRAAGETAAAAPAARPRQERAAPEEPPVTVEEEVDTEDLDQAPLEEEQDIEIVNVEPEAPPPAEEAPPPPRIEIEEVPAPSDAELFGAREVSLDRTPEPEEGEGPVFGARRVTGERQYFGEPIDMSLKDADVVETLRSFATISGLNIVIQPDVSGRVTVELENVPWDQALEQILKINGLGYEVEGNIMRIATLETLSREAAQQQQLEAAKALARPLQTVMKRLSYAAASDVAGLLRSGGGGRGSILSQRGSVIVDDRSNTLILSELPEYMDTVLAIIDNLDEPEPQVMIEARIIETTKRFSRELGIQWGFDLEAGPATGNSTGLEFPNNLDAAGSVNLGTAGQNALVSVSMGNILDTFRLDAILNAAEEDGLVNILSTPKVATLNNQPAVIQSGVQVPIQTVANNTVTVQFVNATLRLEVLPQITADGTVVMNIDIQKREVQTAFLLPGATNAPIATKEAETQVLVRDGGTAVIGGIYEVSTDQSENRVPGLANIPIIGHLFRNHQRTDENEELLIFITPRVVRL